MTYLEPLLPVLVVVALMEIALRRHSGMRIALAVGLGLLAVSLPFVDWLVSRPLEGRYHVQPFSLIPVQAIVVLSSAVHKPLYERPYALPDGETYARCRYAAWIQEQMRDTPVLACGGAMEAGDPPYAATMSELLVRQGVPRSLVWTESRSRSTPENAVFGAEELRRHNVKRIVLVVDANSMLRAEASYRRQGIAVVPAPCSYRQLGRWSEELLPNWRAIERNEATLHEMAGLAWYWLRGWI